MKLRAETQLNTLTRLIAATIGMLTFTAMANAASIQQYGGAGKQLSPSIIFLGEPLNCAVDVCPKEEAEAETAAPKSEALVDAAGMPTKMPTLLRGGQSSDPELTFTKETATVVAPAGQNGQSQEPTPQAATDQSVEPQAIPASSSDAASDGPPIAPAGIKVE
jgi:hypothetical protein